MKKIILFLTVALISITASAQYNVNGHRFFDNWSVGVDGGINTNLHDWNNGGGVLGVQVTKGITPVVSFEFASQIGLNDVVWDGDGVSWNVLGDKKHISTIHAIASTKVNLMNWFGGYLGHPRLFEIQARGGLGYLREVENEVNSAVGKVGFDFDFNVGKQRAWALSLKPAVVWNACNYAAFNGGRNATAQLTAGVSYRFKTSNGTHNFKEVDPVTVTEVVEKIVEVEKPVEVIKVVERVDTVFVEAKEENFEPITITFANNSAELTEEAKNTLSNAQGDNFVVEATATPYGTEDYNKALSQKRADNVANFLKAQGKTIAEAKGLGIQGKNSKRIAKVTLK